MNTDSPSITFEAIEPFLKLAEEQEKSLYQDIGEWLAQISDYNKDQLMGIYGEINNLTREVLDKAKIDRSKIVPLLKEANFWITPSMRLDLLYKLKALLESPDVTSERTTSTFIEYYKADEWSELENMISDWQYNPHFANRMHIITDALEAHISGKYTLVIPTLLSQVEGVASSILGKSAGPTTGLIRKAIQEDQQIGFLRAVSKDILIEFITSPRGYGRVGKKNPEDFTPYGFSNWLKSQGIPDSQSINRHGVLHGVHLNYDSTENSLRVFLLLDVFHGIERLD